MAIARSPSGMPESSAKPFASDLVEISVSLTATVATRPRATLPATVPPAMSTCAMIQPPKMSPLPLASAGIGITRIGRTSITVHVEVFAERNPANPHVVKVTEANLTYVAIDRDGKSRVFGDAV